MIKDKKIFVTGGAGFIGSHIISRLFKSNKVVIYDNLKRNAIKFTDIVEHPNVEFINGDVLDKEKLVNAMRGSDICVHAAAIAGIYSVGESAKQTMLVNMVGTQNALEAVVSNGVRRFIDFSTSEVYGPFVFKGSEADSTAIGPVGEKRWVYAISKLAGEHLAHTYSHANDLEVVTVRPFNVYGPRQVGEGAIQQMIARALRDEEITIYNDGTQIRSWCYVTDFVDAMIEALHSDKAANEVFNFGNPQATTTILSLAESIIRLTSSKSRLVFKPHPGPEVEMRVPDVSKALKLLDYEPKVGLEEGLELSIDWYRNYSEDD